jgi:predicted permease
VFDVLIRDGRYALRMLRKTPGFTLAAVVTLALGIGANTAVFSVVDALLLQPLPFPHPDRLALLQYHTRTPTSGDNRGIGATGRMWFAVHEHATQLDAAVVGGTSGVNLVAGDNAAYVQDERVSAGYFRVLGISPVIGREFTADEDRAGAPPVAILSYGLWQNLFKGDIGIVGRAIRLKGDEYTVVGVTPATFPITERSTEAGAGIDLWTPLKPALTGEGGGYNFDVIVRLPDGVSWPEAQNDVRAASGYAFPNLKPGALAELGLVPMQTAMTEGERRPVLMLWGAVAIVLLIACVNIAGLLLARGSTRTREIAIRMALGSGRAAVIRQLLIESGLLALSGGVVAVVIAWGALDMLGSLAAQVFGLWQPLALNTRVLLGTLGIAFGTSVLFGLVPAVQTSRLDVQAALAESGTRGVAGGANRWPRRVLVIGEVALGVILLVSAGLLIRTFIHLRDINPGFDNTHLVTASVSLEDARYHDTSAIAHLFDDTILRLRATPGVQDAAVALGMPYTRQLNDGFRRVDGPRPDGPNDFQIMNETYVTPGFFATLKVPVRAGRVTTDADTSASPLVAVVNDAFVAHYYKDDPTVIGRHITTEGRTLQIIGIVGNIAYGGGGVSASEAPIGPLACIYVPLTQMNAGFLDVIHRWMEPSWVVRSTLPLETLVPDLRRTIASVDPQLPIAQVKTIDDLRGARLASERFMVGLLAALAFIALVLAAVGIHGLIASSVNERTRELGIRLALGATAGQAIRAVVLPGVMFAGIGVIIGAGAASAATRLLQSFVWGVTPSDPLTFAAVIAVLLTIALVASLVPALRVLKLDPAATLRAE